MITFYPDGSKTDTRSLAEAKAARLNGIASECSYAIENAGIDTITQSNASLGIYSVERQEEIKNYIARCRDEYAQCKQLVESSSTNDAVDSVIFIAPAVEVAHLYTAEQIVSQYFSAYQIAALQRLEMALLQAGKPLGQNMTALKAWMEAMLVASVDPTPRTFDAPPCSYEAASLEAVAGLQA